MGRFFAVLATLVMASCSFALACPAVNAQTAPPSLPPLFAGGGGGGPQPYYCMASTSFSTVGDLSPDQWARHVQVCNTSCDYQPASLNDPHSMLVPTTCGPGWHDPVYLTQPPPAPKAGAGTLHLVDTGCKAMAPSKAPPAAPAPTASPSA